MESSSALSIEQRLTLIEERNLELENKLTSLLHDNKSLSSIIFDLHTIIQDQDHRITELESKSVPYGVLPKTVTNNFEFNTDIQSDLNCNIIIRGLDISSDSEQFELDNLYQGVRQYIGLDSDKELDPVKISILPASESSRYNNRRPVIVELRSVNAKKKLLQSKRIFKSISSQDIGFKQEHNRNLKISEQLTKKNQELFYQACGLRDLKGSSEKFKFVWTSNGQILARKREKSKVIRIKNIDQINLLKGGLNDE